MTLSAEKILLFKSRFKALLSVFLRISRVRQSPAMKPQPTQEVTATFIRQLDFDRLPVLTATQLIQCLDVGPLLANIKRHVSVSEEHWAMMYQPAIHRYLEYCQLAPASGAHHHAGPGGLIVHTIEALDIALRKRKKRTLATVTGPEIEKQEEHTWTYAVFAAVLLHDVGKLATSTVLVTLNSPTGEVAVPFHKTLCEQNVPYYRIEFRQPRGHYKLHTRISPAAMHILPQVALAWLAQSPQILGQLMAYLMNDFYEAGAIGDLALNADQESTADNLKIGGDRIRFPNAPTIPLVDHVLRMIRDLILQNELRANQNGGAIWTDTQFAYAVCGTLATKVIEHLKQLGVPIPSDNNRIFDLLQEHGVIECLSAKKAIWTIQVEAHDNSYRHKLTVLKFELFRLYPPFRCPEPFAGTITVVSDVGTVPSKPEQAMKIIEPESNNLEAYQTKEVGSDALEMKQSESTVTSHESEVQLDVAGEDDPFAADSKLNQTLAHAITNSPPQTAIPNQRAESLPEISNSVSNSSVLAPVGFEDLRPAHVFDDTKIGELFLDWLARCVQTQLIKINTQEARVHVVNEGILVVTPIIFKDYIKEFNLLQGESITLEMAAKKVQSRFEKLKRTLKTDTGSNLHKYLIRGENRTSLISAYLFEPQVLFGTLKAPPVNPFVIKPIKKAN